MATTTNTSGGSASSSTAPTPDQVAAAQAVIAADAAAKKQASDAAALAALAPIATVTGPGFAALIAALQANQAQLMQWDASVGQAIANALVTNEFLVNLVAAKLVSAGGAVSTT